MQNLFGFIFVLMILVLLIGMIRPAVFVDRKTGIVPTRKIIATGSLALMLISLAMIGVFAEDPALIEKIENPEIVNFPVKANKEPEDDPQRKALPLDAKSFKKAFNNASNDFSAYFNIEKIVINEGPVNDTFRVSFNDNQGIVGTLNKQGELLSVTIISMNDNIFILAGILVKTFASDLDKKQASDLASELIAKAQNNAGDFIRHESSNIEFYASSTETIGFWFGAEGTQIN